MMIDIYVCMYITVLKNVQNKYVGMVIRGSFRKWSKGGQILN